MEKTIVIQTEKDVMSPLFGTYDENIKLIQELLNVHVSTSSDGIVVRGEMDDVEKCESVISNLASLIMQGEIVDKMKVRSCVDMVLIGKAEEIIQLAKDCVAVTARGKTIKAKTLGQRDYVNAIKNNTVVFGVGPAGTGKTYLAVALAVMAFNRNEVEKIILTRPAIEAGERLGFLPGDLQQKVDPYLRPLYDALQEMFGIDSYNKLIERGIIEIAPLAYMRGRTLSNAYIILDEAQNTTIEQMKMFLTRMGSNSKVIVNGDTTQIDLPDGKMSGLKHATGVLKNIEDISIVTLTYKDIVRHELVQKIVNAYEKK